jgi:hypothetical protein
MMSCHARRTSSAPAQKQSDPKIVAFAEQTGSSKRNGFFEGSPPGWKFTGRLSHQQQGRASMNKILTALAVAAGLTALSACNQSPQEQAADNIEANAENIADNLEEAADNTAMESTEDNLENAADATREAGENAADEVRNGADADGNSAD